MSERAFDELKAAVGDRVHWVMSSEKGSERYAAIVSGVHDDGLVDLSISSPGVKDFIIRTRVPHASVAFKPQEDWDNPGRWRHTDRTRQLDQLLAKGDALRAEARELGVSPAELLRQRKGAADA